jgi:fatty acid desaturase
LFLRAHNTLAGRVILGPVFLVVRFLWLEAASVRRTPTAALRIWVGHAVGVAAVLWWTSVICGMPFATYIGFFVYPGLALTLIRSFAEHRAAADPLHRTAIVEGAPLLGLLFLHNNLHVAHHAAPSLPWFDLPRYYRANRADFVQRNNGLVYRGYLDVARRYLLAQHDSVAHPQQSSRLVPAATGQKN